MIKFRHRLVSLLTALLLLGGGSAGTAGQSPRATGTPVDIASYKSASIIYRPGDCVNCNIFLAQAEQVLERMRQRYKLNLNRIILVDRLIERDLLAEGMLIDFDSAVTLREYKERYPNLPGTCLALFDCETPVRFFTISELRSMDVEALTDSIYSLLQLEPRTFIIDDPVLIKEADKFVLSHPRLECVVNDTALLLNYKSGHLWLVERGSGELIEAVHIKDTVINELLLDNEGPISRYSQKIPPLNQYRKIECCSAALENGMLKVLLHTAVVAEIPNKSGRKKLRVGKGSFAIMYDLEARTFIPIARIDRGAPHNIDLHNAIWSGDSIWLLSKFCKAEDTIRSVCVYSLQDSTLRESGIDDVHDAKEELYIQRRGYVRNSIPLIVSSDERTVLAATSDQDPGKSAITIVQSDNTGSGENHTPDQLQSRSRKEYVSVLGWEDTAVLLSRCNSGMTVSRIGLGETGRLNCEGKTMAVDWTEWNVAQYSDEKHARNLLFRMDDSYYLTAIDIE